MMHGVSLSDPAAAYPHFSHCGPTAASLSLTPSNYSSSGSPVDPMVTNGQARSASGSCSVLSPATSAAIAALTAAAAASAGIPPNVKDSRWLTLEVCRQFQRNQCSRDENECKFAHPPTHVDVQNGRVICCYDSIKGKCQRRDPPCKYLHPPQHLREQLVQNGRNNMIIRNMQLQLFQHQLMAQTGILPLNPSAVAAAAVVAAQAAATTSLPGSGTNASNTGANCTPNSLLYPGPGTLTIGAPTVSSAYPLLNMGFTPILNAITSSSLPSTVALHLTCPEVLPSTDTNNTTPNKRSALTDAKGGLPLYLSRTNGVHMDGTGGKLDGQENSSSAGGCMMVVNGGSIDALTAAREINDSPHSCSVTMRSAGATGTNMTATAATLYALQHSHGQPNASLLNMQPTHHATHTPTIASLQASPLNAAIINGSTCNVGPTHFSTVQDHAGFFQPHCHIEIPSYPYQ